MSSPMASQSSRNKNYSELCNASGRPSAKGVGMPMKEYDSVWQIIHDAVLIPASVIRSCSLNAKQLAPP